MIENSPGGDFDDGSSRWTYNSFGQKIFTKPRRFVIVRSGGPTCLAVPITSYGGRGVGKPGVKKSDHCIIYSGAQSPTPTGKELPEPPELGMQALPIKVDADDRTVRLDEMSRVDFSKPVSVDSYTEVKNFGKVNPKSMHALVSQFQIVMGARPIPISAVTAPARLQISKAQHRRARNALVRGGWSVDEATEYVQDFVAALRRCRETDEESESGSDTERRSDDGA